MNRDEFSHPSVPQSWLAALQRNGYRLTGARRAVVEAVAGSVYLLTPADIYNHAARFYPRLGRVTVYRTLDRLEELGMVQRVHTDGNCHSYIASPPGHQHLLICTACNRAEYFSGDDLTALMDHLGQTFGYAIHSHWLQLFGLCKQCQGNEEVV